MKEDTGTIIYEVGDTVQCVSGSDKLSIGIVIGVMGSELRLWGKAPSNAGGARLDWQVRAIDVKFIGKGILRPILQGEVARPLVHPAPRSRPHYATRQPSLSHPIKPTQSRPEVKAPTVEKTVEKPAAAVPQFGGDSESISIPRPPLKYPEATPEMMETAVFRGPSARQLLRHNVPIQSAPIQQESAPVQSQGGDERGQEAFDDGLSPRVEVSIPRPKARASRRRQVSDVQTAANEEVRNSGGSGGLPNIAGE